MSNQVDPVLNEYFVNKASSLVKKNQGYIRTIYDLQRLVYGNFEFDRMYYGLMSRKTDISTTLGGFWNAIFGAMVWSQLNMEANAFGVIPKKPWTRSGWRVKTQYDLGTTLTGGTAEGGTLPTPVAQARTTLSTKPKSVVHTFAVTQIQQLLSVFSADDVIPDTIEYARRDFAEEHIKMINRMLLAEVTDSYNSSGDNLETIDRIVASNSEKVNCGFTANNGSHDLYGGSVVRETTGYTAWADSVVIHNNGTNQTFTIQMLDSLIEQTRPYRSGGQRILLTGHDTFEDIQQELQVQQRFTNVEKIRVQPSVNGVQAVEPGIPAGFVVTSYRDIPIIVSDDVPKDGSSRIYLLDLGYLFFKTLSPTRYYESGITTKGDPFPINQLADKGAFVTIGEVICTNFKAQGKIRDLA